MKTLKIMTLCCISVLLFSSCEEHHDTGGPMPIAVEDPGNIISVQEADKWYKNYGTDRAPIIEEGVNDQYPTLTDPYKTTRFVTADYETLKKYMAFIDQESKAAGVTPQGLRIYFAATDATSKGPGKETVFMNPVATFDGVKGNISYAIATSASGVKKAVTVGSVIDSTKSPNGANLIFQGGSIQSLAGDDLQWPPPPYPNDSNDYH